MSSQAFLWRLNTYDKMGARTRPDTYFEGRDLHKLDVAAVFFQLHAMAQQLLSHAFLVTH